MPIKPAGSFKPGSLAPASGFVQIPGVEGEKTVVRGRRFPPTNRPGDVYVYTAVPIRKTVHSMTAESDATVTRIGASTLSEAA